MQPTEYKAAQQRVALAQMREYRPMIRLDLTQLTRETLPAYAADAMTYPWAWVKVGKGYWARYTPEEQIVELARGSTA